MKKKYDREFKLNIVKHYRENGKSMTLISPDFEVPMGTLTSWIQECKEQKEKRCLKKDYGHLLMIKKCKLEFRKKQHYQCRVKKIADLLECLGS